MPPRWLTRRWLPLLATVVMTGCPCTDTRVTRTAYAALASYPDQLTACVVDHRCRSLCSAVFQLSRDVDIERCDVTSLDGAVGPPPHGSLVPNLRQLRGAMIEVAYFEHTTCDDGFDVVIGGGDDSADDGSTNDGNDDGSTDDGSDDGSNDGSDDGSMDGGGGDDGSGTGDDGGGDDGGGDDGGGDDGGGDGFSGRGAIRPAPGPTVHTAPSPHAPMQLVR